MSYHNTIAQSSFETHTAHSEIYLHNNVHCQLVKTAITAKGTENTTLPCSFSTIIHDTLYY